MPEDIRIQIDKREDTAYHYSVSLNRTQTIIPDKILNQQDIAFIFGLNKSLKNLFENDSFYKLSLDKQKELGSCLFTIWFGDHWKTLLETLPPTDLIRITIASQDSDILNLPWELMTPDNSDPLGTDTKFSIRRYPGIARNHSPGKNLPRAGPLRILFMSCAPKELQSLSYEREEEFLLKAISGLDVGFDSCDMGSFEELEQRVEEFKPHIIHLTGHGIVKSDGKGYFAFEDASGNSDLRSSDDIRRILAGQGVQCVFVSGCQTGMAPYINALKGICQNLVNDQIPFVIGWAASIIDDYAIDFARNFYQSVAANVSIDQSLTLARWKLWDALKPREDLSWLLPVLYASLLDGQLFDLHNREEPKRRLQEIKPLPGMIEGFATHFVGRRRELQQILPRLRTGELSVVILTGIGGAGKSALATKIARKLQDQDHYIPIPIPSSHESPLNIEEIIETFAIAFESPDYLIRPDISPSSKLKYIFHKLNLKKYLLVFDNFEVNLDDSNSIIDVGVANLYQQLFSGISGESRVIITSRYRPANRSSLTQIAYECQLGDLNQSDIRKIMFNDKLLISILQSGEMFEDLLANLYRVFGGVPRFIDQIISLITENPEQFLNDLKSVSLPEVGDPTELQKIQDEYYNSLLLDKLYSLLTKESQLSLIKCSVYSIAVPADGFAEAAGIDKKTINKYINEWRNLAFIYPYTESGRDDLWLGYGMIRTWLKNKLDAEDVKSASIAAGDYLSALVLDDQESEIDVDRIQFLVEARSLYLQANDLDKAREVTKWLSGYYIRRGMYDTVRSLNYELIECEDHPLPIFWIGRADIDQGRYDHARQLFSKILNKYLKYFDRGLIASTLVNLGTIFTDQGIDQGAYKHLNDALDIFTEIEDKIGIAKTLHNLGTIDLRQGKYQEACKKSNEALKILDVIGDLKGKAATLHQLGTIYLYLGNDKEANNRFSEALEICKVINDPKGIASTLNQLGTISVDHERYSQAYKYFIQALQIFEKLKSPQGIADEYNNIGFIFQLRNNPEGAVKLIGVAYYFYNSINHRNTNDTFYRLQQVASELGYSLEKVSEIIQDAVNRIKKYGAVAFVESIFKEV